MQIDRTNAEQRRGFKSCPVRVKKPTRPNISFRIRERNETKTGFVASHSISNPKCWKLRIYKQLKSVKLYADEPPIQHVDPPWDVATWRFIPQPALSMVLVVIERSSEQIPLKESALCL
jgi:hypothetical protein